MHNKILKKIKIYKNHKLIKDNLKLITKIIMK